MAKRKHKTKALGLPPEDHRSRAAKFEQDAVRLLRDADAHLDENKCAIAFDRLIDGISYAGMAEAEHGGAGDQPPKDLSALAAKTIRAFRTTCGVKD